MRKNLKEARKRAGMTQKQVAEYLGVTLRTYQRMEEGTLLGHIRSWDALEDLFKIHQRVLRLETDRAAPEDELSREDAEHMTELSGKIGYHFVKTREFEKSVAISMSFIDELWNMINSNKNFCMVLEYNAEAMNVKVNYYAGTLGETPVENG